MRRLPDGYGLRLGLLALVLALVAGCSSNRMAYRYADWGLVWWVEDYVTLTDAQRSQLEADFQAFRQWHCSTELPRYSQWLADLEQDLAEGRISEPQIRQRQQQLFTAVERLLVRATPLAANLLADLSPAQVEELEARMAADQQEKEQEYLSPDPGVAVESRENRTRERAERWLGDLNAEQRRIIADWNRARGNQTGIWLEGRQRWQAALLETLELRPGEAFRTRLATLIQDSASVRGEGYQAMMADSREALASLVSDLLSAADASQIQHLTQQLADLRRDFEALSCTAEG
ncbi:MAG: DUF6279 family lipoprotein [Marinobacter sp.]|uniref:DUF6279 family lipoprotein n=1 Tax=Marinobacter sp. TaxID=50741 RepID=UPI00299E5827|nr:DUF6279 family lipoprotein [Marinobacter sp.]MDX1633985.1 DUF6279 family lipoprotein [Marinobacter sp.]